MPNWKSVHDIESMDTDDIRCEMLKIWHDIDFNILSDEEQSIAIEHLKMYKEVLQERHYEYRNYIRD